jgi:hypothetical protein
VSEKEICRPEEAPADTTYDHGPPRPSRLRGGQVRDTLVFH